MKRDPRKGGPSPSVFDFHPEDSKQKKKTRTENERAPMNNACIYLLVTGEKSQSGDGVTRCGMAMTTGDGFLLT